MLPATGREAEAREQQNPRTTTINQQWQLEPDSFQPASTLPARMPISGPTNLCDTCLKAHPLNCGRDHVLVYCYSPRTDSTQHRKGTPEVIS